MQAKVRHGGGGGGGGGGVGPKRVVSSSCSFATNLIAPFVYSLVAVGGFQFHHPLLFFSFFAAVRYLNYIFIRLRYLSNDIFLLMYIMLLNKLT